MRWLEGHVYRRVAGGLKVRVVEEEQARLAVNMTFDRERDNCTTGHTAEDRERFHYRNPPLVGDLGRFSGHKCIARERFATVTVQLCVFWARVQGSC